MGDTGLAGDITEVVLACSPIFGGPPDGDRRTEIGYMVSLSLIRKPGFVQVNENDHRDKSGRGLSGPESPWLAARRTGRPVAWSRQVAASPGLAAQ
jgi:hypothetical protein